MFEDESIYIACPKCGHKNSVLIRDFEAQTESHIICEKCKVGVKVEAQAFQDRLEQVRTELEAIERQARRESNPRPRRAKDDYQI